MSEKEEMTEEEKQEEKDKVIAWIEGQHQSKKQFNKEAYSKYWRDVENEERKERELEQSEEEAEK